MKRKVGANNSIGLYLFDYKDYILKKYLAETSKLGLK